MTIKTINNIYIQCLDSNEIPVIINYTNPINTVIEQTNDNGVNIIKISFNPKDLLILNGLIDIDIEEINE